MDNYNSFAYDSSADSTENPVLLKCCVEFYRSSKHAKGSVGKHDNEYSGVFGFDKYINGKCQQSSLVGVNAYKSLPWVIPDEKIISGNKNNTIRRYICPYMSIWPPIVNYNGQNISSTAKSEAQIYIRARQLFGGNKKEKVTIRLAVETELGRSSQDVMINNAQTADIELIVEVNASCEAVTIRCVNSFSQNLYINAYVVEPTTNRTALVGRLVLVPNDNIYVTELVPVIVRMKKPNGTYYRDSGSDLSSLCTFIESLPNYLNNKVYSQAFIYMDYTANSYQSLDIPYSRFSPELQRKIDISNKTLKVNDDNTKKLLDEELRLLYSEFVLGDQREQYKVQRQVNEKLRTYFEQLLTYLSILDPWNMEHNKFAYEKKLLTRLTSDLESELECSEAIASQPPLDEVENVNIASSTSSQSNENTTKIPSLPDPTPVRTARQAFYDALALYEQDIRNAGNDPTQPEFAYAGKSYVFFMYDLNKCTADSAEGKVLGFGVVGKGTCVMFADTILDSDQTSYSSGLVAHEIGHGLTLQHPFYDTAPKDLSKYEEPGRRDQHTIKEEIGVLKQQKKVLEIERNPTDHPIGNALIYRTRYKALIETLLFRLNELDVDLTYEFNVDEAANRGEEGPIELNILRCVETLQQTLIQLEAQELYPLAIPAPEGRKNDIDVEISEIDSRIAELTLEQATAPTEIILAKTTEQSLTDENIMDYRQRQVQPNTNSNSDSNNSNFVYRSFWYWQWKKMWTAKSLQVIRLLVILFVVLFPLASQAQNLYFQQKGIWVDDDEYVAMEVDTLNRRGQIYIVNGYTRLEYFSVYFEIVDKEEYVSTKPYPEMSIVPLLYRFGNPRQPKNVASQDMLFKGDLIHDMGGTDILGEIMEANTLGYSFANKREYADTEIQFLICVGNNWSELSAYGSQLDKFGKLWVFGGIGGLAELQMGTFPIDGFKRVRRIKWREFPPQFRNAIKADRESYLLNPQEGPLFIR